MRKVLRLAGPTALIFTLIVITGPTAALAQGEVGVTVEEITDNRVTDGPYVGSLEVLLNLTGDDLEEIDSARVVVTGAKDDKGNDLLTDRDPPDFSSRNSNMGQMKVTLKNPARGAKSINLSGTVELFVPSSDPNAVVSIENALSMLDSPLKSKALDAEKMKFLLVSPEEHAKGRGKDLTPEEIDEIRARGKEEGVDEEEIEAAIEMVRAMKAMAGETSEKSVILSGTGADIDRILRVRLLKGDGSEISTPSRSWGGTDEKKTMVIDAGEELPPDMTLELTILTKAATVSVPVSLADIELP